ncbi:MAG: RcnB family protein [Proteobacteria bacterium]|nr:RcnB family protein [Pseudomonadota bacterium]
MKTTFKFASMALAVLGAVSLPAMARDHGDGHPYYVAYGDDGHGRGRGHDRDDDYDQRRGHDRDRDGRWGDRDDDGRDRRWHRHGHWDNGRRGPPPWARGYDYRSYGYRNVYVVPYAQYRPYRLYAPRPGYRWVRDDGGNFLMVAIASGIIADVLLHH